MPPSPGEPRPPLQRRDFLKLAGLGAAAGFLPRATVMAGPFERADFDKLVPADKKLDPAWVRSLFERGEPAVQRGAELKYIGMPVGGLCAGQLYLGGDGRLWHWDIFNKTSGTGAGHYAKPPEAVSTVRQGFTLQVGGGEKRTLDRVGFEDVAFRGEYPIGTVRYRDPASPVSVTLEAFSPFIPLHAEDSSLPATVLHFTLKNTSEESVVARLSGTLENAIGRSDPWENGEPWAWIVRTAGMTRVDFGMGRGADPRTNSRPDVVFEDWSKESFEGWTVEGTAFGTRPAKREDIPKLQGDLGGDGGNVAVSFAFAPGRSVGEKDGATGKLTSREFVVERRCMNLWVGGGNHPGKTCVNLVVGGKTVRSVTGSNSNRQTLHSVPVGEFKRQKARLEIVDAESGAWGNISVGRITFSDEPAVRVGVDELADFGTMSLALLGADAEIADFDSVTHPEPKDGEDPPPMQIGVLGREVRIEAGASAEVTFLVTWHFPNLELDGLGKVGRHYAARFPDAKAVAEYVGANFERLAGETRLWRDTWYDSTLPYWFLDRTLLNASIVATSTCYRFRDGRFYAWEGVGCCKGTCTHVWHYAQAMARLFPELERDTRERVDLGVALNPQTGVMGFRAEFDRKLAVDGQAGTILRFYREHQMSADAGFLRRNWARIKLTLEPLFALDGNDDGVLEGPQMNTLDTPWYGKIAWLSSLYLGAMRAAAAMADEMGEGELAARCRKIADRGAKNVTEQCFEDGYYVNRVDPAHLETINSGTGCEIDQVFGQSWAFQVGLERVLPEKETRAALASLWRYNFTPDVGPYRAAYQPGRWYAMAGEAGLLMCTFPRSDWDYDRAHGQGNPGFAGYFNECMNGFEYQVAGHMIAEGMVMEGLAVTRAVHDRYHPARRNPWNEIECGDHYARSMASYGVFVAACGYEHHGPRGHLGFAPKLQAEKFRAPFTTAEGWGTYAQEAVPEGLQARVQLRWGSLRLRTLSFETTGRVTKVAMAVETRAIAIQRRPVLGAHAVAGRRVTVTLAEELRLTPSETLEIHLT